MHFIYFFIKKKKKKKLKKKENLTICETNISRNIWNDLIRENLSCEISKIWLFAKISSSEVSKKFIHENKFSRKSIPLR